MYGTNHTCHVGPEGPTPRGLTSILPERTLARGLWVQMHHVPISVPYGNLEILQFMESWCATAQGESFDF